MIVAVRHKSDCRKIGKIKQETETDAETGGEAEVQICAL